MDKSIKILLGLLLLGLGLEVVSVLTAIASSSAIGGMSFLWFVWSLCTGIGGAVLLIFTMCVAVERYVCD